MLSKKEVFLNDLQFKIGDRTSNTDLAFETAEDLSKFFISRHEKANWPFLNFLPVYFRIKQQLETIIGKPVGSDFDLNLLTSLEKVELNQFLSQEFKHPLALQRPKFIHTIIFIFPLFAVLGSLLVSTYLITALDYSGWTYLSALIGFILSFLLIQGSKGLKNRFSPSTLLEYCKSLFVIHNQTINTSPTSDLVERFILDQAEISFNKRFKASDKLV